MKPKFNSIIRLSVVLIGLLIFNSCSSDDSDNPGPPPPLQQVDIAQVDNAVGAFLSTNQVPGASLSVSVNGKMVYSKGYGLANTATSEAVEPKDIFRVASISKVFTATAILKLMEEGRLSLSDKVFGPDSILGDNFGSAVLSANELNVTIDHLLLHQQGGWWTSVGGFDVIDYAPNLSNADFFEYIFTNAELTSSPGTTFGYNNTGYWMLARIIEEVSGMSYESYIKSMVSSIGITSVKATTFRRNDRQSNEVEYYGNSGDSQYIYTISSRRDGDGGLVISSPDLLRFMNAIDGDPVRPDILGSAAQQLLTQTTSLSTLGRGLAVWDAQNLSYFTGSLPGNRSWLMISDNGRSATILLNYRDAGQFDNNLQSLLLNIVNNNSIPWQTELDQF